MNLHYLLILLDQLPRVAQGLHIELLLQRLNLRFQEDVLLEDKMILRFEFLLSLDSLHYPFKLLSAL